MQYLSKFYFNVSFAHQYSFSCADNPQKNKPYVLGEKVT